MAAPVKQKNNLSGEERANLIAGIASDGKAEDITILKLQDVSNITDFFVIFSGTSTTHLKALGDRIEKGLREQGIKPLHVDGQRGTGWMVYDYENVIVHAMLKDSRQLFDLERLWGDAPRIDWE